MGDLSKQRCERATPNEFLGKGFVTVFQAQTIVGHTQTRGRPGSLGYAVQRGCGAQGDHCNGATETPPPGITLQPLLSSQGISDHLL